MPMTQDDIRRHYESHWRPPADSADLAPKLAYSSPVEDAVIYPAYEDLIRDHGLNAEGGRVLDVGCGSGRWIRFFLERYAPARLIGVDFARSSVDLLRMWAETITPPAATAIDFRTVDITDPNLEPIDQFDLVNVANVLFHIPENDKYAAAMVNLRRNVARAGRIVTTEYMPRSSMRTEWMYVRSRYEFEAICQAAGLRIVDVRPTSFFSNDPLGIDGPDQAGRAHFHRVRAGMQTLLGSNNDPNVRGFITEFLANVERAALAYCRERIAPVDLPSQKLVVLAPA